MTSKRQDPGRFVEAPRTALVVIVVITAVILSACASTSSPPSVAAPAAGKIDGAAVYAQRCASCHGADLNGTDKGPSHRSKVYEPGHHNDASFRSAILNGAPAHHWDFGDMAPVVGLSEQEITAVIAYIRETQRREGFIPYP